jgi:transposase
MLGGALCSPNADQPHPPETAKVARAEFPIGNRYLRVADELDILFTDDAILALFPIHGQPSHPTWRLALVTILQFAEGLSDRQAVHAVRSRIDWKYELRLEFTDPGFDASVFSEFRGRLLVWSGESLLSATMLMLKYRNLQRDPRISVCLYDPPVASNDVVISGTATWYDQDIWDDARRIIARYRAAYEMDDSLARWHTEPRVLITVTPERIATWARRRWLASVKTELASPPLSNKERRERMHGKRSEQDRMLAAEPYDPLDPLVSAERDAWNAWRTPWLRHAISWKGMPHNCMNARQSTNWAGLWPN